MKSVVQSTLLMAYAGLTRMLAPVAFAKLNKSAGSNALMIKRQPERYGHVPAASGELWIHAASVGEVHAVAELVRRLVASNVHLKIVISTVTVTGAERVEAIFAELESVRHLFAPLDTGPSLRRWLNHTRPSALLLVETELWPLMLHQCKQRAIPVALVNGRLSERAAARYRKFGALFAPALKGIDPILCQSDTDRQRWISLGAAPAQLQVTGNIKFDRPEQAEPDPRVQQWRDAWADRPVWIAGSTHAGEEAAAVAAHQQILKTFPDALLVLVPRHPERAPSVLNELNQQLNNESISIQPMSAYRSKSTMVIVSEMGVLMSLYSSATACFVGGSLVEGIGGHHLFEPAWAGHAVITGGHTDDQQSAAELLTSADALIRVHDSNTLAIAVIEQFQSKDKNAAGERARTVALAQAGALDRTLAVIQPWLSQG